MEALKSLFGQLIRSWFAYLIIVGKIGVQIIKIANNRTIMVGAITQIEFWLADLRMELLASKKKPLTVIGKKFKTVLQGLEKNLSEFGTEFEDPKELVEIGKDFDTEFFDPRQEFESKSEARELVEDKMGWGPYTKIQWNIICDAIADDYPSLVNAAAAAKAKYPVTAHES